MSPGSTGIAACASTAPASSLRADEVHAGAVLGIALGERARAMRVQPRDGRGSRTGGCSPGARGSGARRLRRGSGTLSQPGADDPVRPRRGNGLGQLGVEAKGAIRIILRLARPAQRRRHRPRAAPRACRRTRRPPPHRGSRRRWRRGSPAGCCRDRRPARRGGGHGRAAQPMRRRSPSPGGSTWPIRQCASPSRSRSDAIAPASAGSTIST